MKKLILWAYRRITGLSQEELERTYFFSYFITKSEWKAHWWTLNHRHYWPGN